MVVVAGGKMTNNQIEKLQEIRKGIADDMRKSDLDAFDALYWLRETINTLLEKEVP